MLKKENKNSDEQFNFDDIAGEKITQHKKDTNMETGIVLSLPTNNPRVYLSKDLAECTGKEFLVWAQMVYPIVNLSIYEKELDILTNRKSCFKSILEYHINLQMSRNSRKDILDN